MPYVLGIHLGATTTSAAIARRQYARHGSTWSPPVVVGLGMQSPTIPTVLCRAQDGSFMAGDEAQRQELTHHEWVVRDFLQMLGDETPLLVGREYVPADQLLAAMIEWVADLVAYEEGSPPEHIAVAHDPAWGPHRTHLAHQALTRIGLGNITLVPEPLAVGVDFAARQKVGEGAPILVGNLGGSGMDATVLRRHQPGFEAVGSTIDIDQPNGAELDDAIFQWVREELRGHTDHLDLSDMPSRVAVFRLRSECQRAKEQLSAHLDASLRVDLPPVQGQLLDLPEVHTQLALSRSKLEHLIRPYVERIPELLQQALQSASLTTEDLHATVLAGGMARIPLVKQLVAQGLDVTPLADAAPELVAARGAALSAIGAVSAVGDRSVPGMAVPESYGDGGAEGYGAEGYGAEGYGSDGYGGDGYPGGYSSGNLPSPNIPPEYEVDPPGAALATRPPIEVEPMDLPPVNHRRKRVIQIVKLSVAGILIIIGVILTFTQHWGTNPAPPPGGGVLQQR